MATYDSLTQADKNLLAAWERELRAFAGHIGRGIVVARALDAARTASGGAQDIIDTLDPGEVIPNSGGLSGAQDLDTAEFGRLVTGLTNFLTSYDTTATRQDIAKAKGPTAGLE